MDKLIIARTNELPDDPAWLRMQPCPVIGYGEDQQSLSADVLVTDMDAARTLQKRIEAHPIAAMMLVQVLRSTEVLPSAQGLDVESLAYSTLQSGEDYANWRNSRDSEPQLVTEDTEPVLVSRTGSDLQAVLNRPATRNSISVEMRDALMEVLAVLEADDSISRLLISGRGACFSVGGELGEFGLSPDPATAHWVRSVHSPARKIDQLGDRITFYVHGACLGSGIELPAFSSRVVAHPKTFFQLPELELGLIPGAGGTVSLTRRIGRQRTAWMVLSGKRINAKTALQWGLVDEITDWKNMPDKGDGMHQGGL